jgi:hypothetical protein
MLPFADRRAFAFAQDHHLAGIVGTDVHHLGDLDSCYQYMEPFDGPASFLDSLRRAHFVKGCHPPGYFIRTAYVILRDQLGIGAPEAYGRNCTRERSPFQVACSRPGKTLVRSSCE